MSGERILIAFLAALFAFAAAAALGAFPAGAQTTEARCDVDVNGDTYIDIIGDVSSVNNWAYQAVPPAPAEYDLNGDGHIDIIGDISTITNYVFGPQCFGMTMTDYVDPGDSIMGVAECKHRGYAWYKDKHEPYAILSGFQIEGSTEPAHWYGKTLCAWSGSLYSIFCWFQLSSYEPGHGWTLRGFTQQEYGFPFCGANSVLEETWIPLGQPFRYTMEHCIYNDGMLVHGCHYHENDEYWVIY